MSTTASSRRHTAGERREDVVEAAMAEFAVAGLHGTSTEAIARRAGISQPYLFRLYGTKKELFVAAVERCFERTLEAMQMAAVGKRPDEIFHAMGRAYSELLAADRKMLLVQLQAYAACEDPDVRDAVRRRFGELYTYVERVSGRSEEDVRRFFSIGMLINVAAAMDIPALREGWAERCMGVCNQE